MLSSTPEKSVRISNYKEKSDEGTSQIVVDIAKKK